jgi:hypothetical protein
MPTTNELIMYAALVGGAMYVRKKLKSKQDLLGFHDTVVAPTEKPKPRMTAYEKATFNKPPPPVPHYWNKHSQAMVEDPFRVDIITPKRQPWPSR